MINIDVYGTGRKSGLKKLIHRAALSYLKALLPRKRKVNVKIEVIDELESLEGVFGECYEYSNDEHYKYVIRLDNNKSIHTTLVTLAHEFVHLKQYDRKELRFYDKSTKWKGVVYDNYVYDDAPWEIEASAMENQLYDNFVNAE